MVSWAKQKQAGFTIVELLIVIVVIAILATISAIAYNGIQNRANDAVVEADISHIIKKMEIANIDNGHYPKNAAEFPNFKLSKTAYDTAANNVYYCSDITNNRYALGLRSKSGKGYIVNTGSVTAGGDVNSITTCRELDITWGNDATKYSIQGWFADTSPPRWSTGWSWTN